MSTRRSMVLAIVLALLAGYFALFEGFSSPGAAPDSTRDEKLFDCTHGAPEEITVVTQSGSVSARRNGEQWQTTVGGLAPAAFEGLAESLCRLPVIDRIHLNSLNSLNSLDSRAAQLEEFGLEPPAAEIHAVAAGQDRRLLIGTPTPASNLMYAKLADRPEVWKIGVELASNVERLARLAPPGDGA
jgi:hypothetical protein